MKTYKRAIYIVFQVIAILIILELLSIFGRLTLGKSVQPWIPKHQDPCRSMKTNVIFSHEFDNKGNCQPLNGKIEGQFVYYGDNTAKNAVLVFGGSTTSGFYQHYSNGETWPMLLQKKLGAQYNVINGGIGGYSSTQELLKILTSLPRIKQKITHVVTLNGINEFPNYPLYDNTEHPKSRNYPFLTTKQNTMNEANVWIDQGSQGNIKWFANLQSLTALLAKKIGPDLKINNGEIELLDNRGSIFIGVDSIDRWNYSVLASKKISEIYNSEYFVFLQPTILLDGVQNSPVGNSSDGVIYNHMVNKMPKKYNINLNNMYVKLRERCDKLDYCYDISNIAPPVGNNYSDGRHHNENGNKIISEAIHGIISNN
jgi:lysophospholipase L1-like esterase